MGLVYLGYKVKTRACFLRMLSNSKGAASNIGDWQGMQWNWRTSIYEILKKLTAKVVLFLCLVNEEHACFALPYHCPPYTNPNNHRLEVLYVTVRSKSLYHNSSIILFPLNQPKTLVTNQRKAMMQYELKCLDINI